MHVQSRPILGRMRFLARTTLEDACLRRLAPWCSPHPPFSVRSQTGKPTQSPTMRWVFQMFEGIDLLLIFREDQVVSRQVLNLRPDHLKIIDLLGPQVQNCYSTPK